MSQDSGIQFNEYPPALISAPGATIVGTFDRLVLGPEYDFGNGPVKPLIAVITLESGELLAGREKDSPAYDGEVGREYALWMIHTVLADRMKELRPAKGERIAVRYDGIRVKRGADPNDRNAQYHSWSAVCPDRPAEIIETSWDD